MAQIFTDLETNPEMGISLGNNVYKIRLAISSKGKGKSGGARIITYVTISENTVLLPSIYNKGDRATISDEEISEILKSYL